MRDRFTSVIFFLVLLVPSCFAEMERGTLLGPLTFTRSNAKPYFETVKFDRGDFRDPFVFHVRNGDPSGMRRTTNATVFLNGQMIYGSYNFLHNEGAADIRVRLEDHSVLQVMMSGKPGSKLTLWIDGRLLPTHAIISPKGGHYEFRGGTILDIPAGAVSGPTAIRIEPVNSSAVQNFLDQRPNASMKYHFLGGFAAGPNGLQFLNPVQVTLRAAPLSSPKEIPLVGLLDDQLTGFELQEGTFTYDGTKGLVISQITHFSDYVIPGYVNLEVPDTASCRTEGPNLVAISNKDKSTNGDCQIVSENVSVSFNGCQPSFTEWYTAIDSSGSSCAPVQVATVELNPLVLELDPPDTGSKHQGLFELRVLDKDGQEVPNHPPASWLSYNTSVATVDSTGLVTAVARGTTKVQAKIGEDVGIAEVRVGKVGYVEVQPPEASLYKTKSLKLTATAYDRKGGQKIPDRTVIWRGTMQPQGIATIDPFDGVVHGAGTTEGDVTVVPEVDGIKSETPAIVHIVEVASIDVTEAIVAVEPGVTVTFVATPKDSNRRIVVGAPLVWESNNDVAARSSQDPTVYDPMDPKSSYSAAFDAKKMGVATISASVDGDPGVTPGTAKLVVGFPLSGHWHGSAVFVSGIDHGSASIEVDAVVQQQDDRISVTLWYVDYAGFGGSHIEKGEISAISANGRTYNIDTFVPDIPSAAHAEGTVDLAGLKFNGKGSVDATGSGEMTISADFSSLSGKGSDSTGDAMSWTLKRVVP